MSKCQAFCVPCVNFLKMEIQPESILLTQFNSFIIYMSYTVYSRQREWMILLESWTGDSNLQSFY